MDKGQEISEESCDVLKPSKKTKKCFPDFCPMGLKWVKSTNIKAHFNSNKGPINRIKCLYLLDLTILGDP